MLHASSPTSFPTDQTQALTLDNKQLSLSNPPSSRYLATAGPPFHTLSPPSRAHTMDSSPLRRRTPRRSHQSTFTCRELRVPPGRLLQQQPRSQVETRLYHQQYPSVTSLYVPITLTRGHRTKTTSQDPKADPAESQRAHRQAVHNHIPGAPEDPEGPEAPGAPGAPCAPGAPPAPLPPAGPGAPEAPLAPETPAMPAGPGAPTCPGAPEEP